jgi:radical SAM superfamily enzyme YgiQ (UPF0313 family)
MLIQPPMYHQKVHLAPNLGLASIAAVLERDGCEVQIVEAAAEDLNFDDILDRVRQFKPRMIGAGGQTPVSPRSLTIFSRVKHEVDVGITTIAGGPHFTFTDRESLNQCPELDAVVRGEGEATISHLVSVLSNGGTMAEVNGLTWRSNDGTIVRNPDRAPITDLDSLPFPAWHLFPVEKYHWAGNKMLATSSSRGCPYHCSYCITWKVHQGVRHRNPAKIVEEMVWVKKNFNHDTFFFQDDASFLVRGQMEGFLDELEKCGEKLYWYYETREDIFLSYKDMWQRMKKNGLFKIVFGLETPDPKLRQICGKDGYDNQAVENMMKVLEKELDILVSVYLLFGLPEDTVESMQTILDYGKHLYPDYCSFVVGSLAVPFPGTDMFIKLKEQGAITTYDWKDYGYGKSVIKLAVPPETLEETFKTFWVKTYSRPKAMLKQLQFYFSGNRFRKAMAKQYVRMAIEMISDVKKMSGKKEDGF